MHPLLDETHELVRKSAAEFAEREIDPFVKNMENYEYPRDLLRDMGKLGLLAPMGPIDYGGPGLDFRSEILTVEEVAKHSPGVATILEIQGSLIVDTLATYGNNAIKEKYLSKAISGETIISYALSEPCCGSDAAALESVARRERGEWVLNGHKMWITSGMNADAYLVFARTGPKEERHKSITAFMVDRNKCVETSPIHVIGLRGTGTAEVKFVDCELGDDAVVGEVNKGFYVAINSLNLGRTCVGSIGLGIAERAMREAISYIKQRSAFGRSLADFQVLQHYVANMYAQTESVRSLVYSAAYMRDKSLPDFLLYAHSAKLLGSRLGVESTRVAIQMMGGMGLSTDNVLEMLYRDAKVTEIYEGANEIILNTIYRFMEK
ncbi:acyl-CoA dehydrogenase [Thermocladium modestius]|uniref:Acyl-CoA dehydrogenase n=1 Tax=Thermocladium modestius TaxID=62609 RepID=A0A830GX46_9CREN|nr:acyl-CoA dehydrogenase family protein [Thermocladium modestius]GGP21604.1 acyl-CoA dehydrogenase [Thermocladium modestius]